MDAEQIKAAARRFFEGSINQRNPAEVDAYFAPHMIDHGVPPRFPRNIHGRKMLNAIYYRAFPDARGAIDDILVEGDRVVVRYTMHGSHDGEFMGLAPTGRTFVASGFFEDRFEGDQAVEHWEIFDEAEMMRQLGLLPAMVS